MLWLPPARDELVFEVVGEVWMCETKLIDSHKSGQWREVVQC